MSIETNNGNSAILDTTAFFLLSI